jgi:hypothetical protein
LVHSSVDESKFFGTLTNLLQMKLKLIVDQYGFNAFDYAIMYGFPTISEYFFNNSCCDLHLDQVVEIINRVLSDKPDQDYVMRMESIVSQLKDHKLIY